MERQALAKWQRDNCDSRVEQCSPGTTCHEQPPGLASRSGKPCGRSTLWLKPTRDGQKMP